MTGSNTDHLKYLERIASEDVEGVKVAEAAYGSSWKKRGGVGAFMMLARKWDRLEQRVSGGAQYDIFRAILEDKRPEGIVDDIRDLRRYLLLVEAEMRSQGAASATGVQRDNRPESDDRTFSRNEDNGKHL